MSSGYHIHIPLRLTPRASRRQHNGRRLLLGQVRWDEKSIGGLSVGHFKSVRINVCVYDLFSCNVVAEHLIK